MMLPGDRYSAAKHSFAKPGVHAPVNEARCQVRNEISDRNRCDSTSFDYTLFTNLASNDPLNLVVSTPAQSLTSLDVELLNIIGFGRSPTMIYGNQDHLSVNADNNIGETIIVGNGDYDFVSANYSSYCTIIVGNGVGDTVSGFDSRNDTIILGNGDRDTVYADCSVRRLQQPRYNYPRQRQR
jgi:hypothetical protein